MAYSKNYDDWNILMKTLESRRPPYFKEREIWWTITGVNVGHEEDGKGEYFQRPVLILKKFGKHTFIGIPLSSTNNVGKTYFEIIYKEQKSTALLGQIKTFDSRRLNQRYEIIPTSMFTQITKAVRDLLTTIV